MKLGACSGLYFDKSLPQTLDLLHSFGIEGVEVYCGGPLNELKHIDPEMILHTEHGAKQYLDEFRSRGMFLSSLNCSGNPVHPDPERARIDQEGFERTVLVAEKLGIKTIVNFSGTPGGGPHDLTPNWVTCAWPDEYLQIRRYQWEDVLIPYWTKAVRFAKDHGIEQIGIEMHPGFCVYSVETLLQLRKAVGPEIGANFDPSHIMWQGADPEQAIEKLGSAIFSVHAKDVARNERVVEINGVNDAKHYSNAGTRAWTFRTVGYGHGADTWKKIVSALTMVGYDGVLNIEHEDMFFSRHEGLQKAASFLKELIVTEQAEKMWWA